MNVNDAIRIVSKDIPKDQLEYWFETENGYVFSFRTEYDPQPLRHHVIVDKKSGEVLPYPEDKHFVEIAINRKHPLDTGVDAILHSVNLDRSTEVSFIL